MGISLATAASLRLQLSLKVAAGFGDQLPATRAFLAELQIQPRRRQLAEIQRLRPLRRKHLKPPVLVVPLVVRSIRVAAIAANIRRRFLFAWNSTQNWKSFQGQG